MKKKILVTSLSLVLLLSLAGCNAPAKDTGADTGSDIASSESTTGDDTTAEKVTTTEAPQVPNLELTDGVVNGNRYENDSFGVAFTIPEGFEENTVSFKEAPSVEEDPNYNPDYYLADFFGYYPSSDITQSAVSVSVSYRELTPEEATKSTEEIVKDRLAYFNNSDCFTWQEYVAGDQTYYGILWTDYYMEDTTDLSQYIQKIYIVRDNKVMNLSVSSAGGHISHSSGDSYYLSVNSELVEQYTEAILNSLELY